MEEKEVWDGAGFYFDLKNIKDSDFELIEQQANKLSDHQAKIGFYKRAMAEIHHASGMRQWDYGGSSLEARTVWNRCKSAIQREEEIAELAAASQQTENSADSGDFTTACRVMALYYLLLAANDGRAVNQSALGRLLEFMTGQKCSSTKRYWQHPLGGGGKASQKNRDIVRNLLLNLELTQAVEWMDKDQQ
jgi:hypothetical protein